MLLYSQYENLDQNVGKTKCCRTIEGCLVFKLDYSIHILARIHAFCSGKMVAEFWIGPPKRFLLLIMCAHLVLPSCLTFSIPIQLKSSRECVELCGYSTLAGQFRCMTYMDLKF